MPMVYEKARSDAQGLLDATWDGKLPVLLTQFTRALNADKLEANLGRKISGQVTKLPSSRAQILINSRDTLQRRRFTWAHELGHIAERTTFDKDQAYSFTDEGIALDKKRGDSYDLHEFYADEFAGSLLMPEDEFIEKCNQGYSIGQLATIFDVSRAAVEQRIKRLKKHPGNVAIRR